MRYEVQVRKTGQPWRNYLSTNSYETAMDHIRALVNSYWDEAMIVNPETVEVDHVGG